MSLVALVGVAVFAFLGSAQSQGASPAVSARLNPAAQAATSRIAFATAPRPDQPPGGELYVVNPDGSEKRLVARLRIPVNYGYGGLGWSPDGQKIAFADASGVVYVVNADGSGLLNLTLNSPRFDVNPSWSPDGQRIAFMRGRVNNPDIYVMNADGSGLRRLTRNGASRPIWSPNGRRIALTRAFEKPRPGRKPPYVWTPRSGS